MSLRRRFGMSLRRRFLLTVVGTLLLVLLAQAVVTLSATLAEGEAHAGARGSALVHAVTITSAPLIVRNALSSRYETIIDQVREAVDLVELAIVDARGNVVAHSDPRRVGERIIRTAFAPPGPPRMKVRLRDVAYGVTEHSVTATILGGTDSLGFVGLRFRSREVVRSASRVLVSALGMGLLWLGLGVVAGSLFIRRITRPLGELTLAATAVSAGRLDDVQLEPPETSDEVGLLQGSFLHLVQALRTEREKTSSLMGELREVNLGLRDRVDAVTADLRETTTYLESIIRCMEEGVITCDRQGVIVKANVGAFRQLRGLGDPTEGAPIARVVPDGGALGPAVASAVSDGAVSQLELARRAPGEGDGVALERHVVFRVYPLSGADGAALGAVVTVVDVTEHRRVESQLRRHDRLISLGTIAAGLAHELGNYMHTINGYSSVLLRNMAKEDPNRGDVEQVHQENGRAVALLDRFLQFARPRSVKMLFEPIDAIVREALDIGSFKLRKMDVELIDELGAGDQEVPCDPRLLTQVFVNLVLNALDAMQDASVRELAVGSRVDGERVRIWVRDTGEGIAHENLERIFDPFFTTKEDTGTGLGLSIAHQIVDRHGGAISVTSEPGHGTTFTVELPLEAASQASQASQPSQGGVA